MRRTLSILCFTLITVSSSLIGMTPAQALLMGGPGDSNLYVGNSYSMDLSCQDNPPTPGQTVTSVGLSGDSQIPPGMNYDPNTLTLSGSPTTAGVYNLGSMGCQISDSLFGDLITGVNLGTLTVIDPNPPAQTTPAAKMTVTPLLDGQCHFHIHIDFPGGWLPDDGSVHLVVQDLVQGGSVFLVDTTAGQTADITLSAWDVVDEVQQQITDNNIPWVVDDFGGRTGCGEDFSASMSYAYAGVRSPITTVEHFRPYMPDTRVTGYKFTGLNDECFIDIGYEIGVTPDQEVPGTPAVMPITYTDGGSTFNFVLVGAEAGTQGFARFSLTHITSESIYGSYSDVGAAMIMLDSTGLPPRCSSWGNVSTDFTSGGYPVSDSESVNPVPQCGRGMYSLTGYQDDTADCVDAPIGSYVPTIGAKVATPCPTGMTTASAGSASPWDCYKPALQTFKKMHLPKIAKVGKTLTIKMLSDQANPMNVAVTGACKAKYSKSGAVFLSKITFAKKAGLCKLTLNAPAAGRSLQTTSKVLIKVTKTGK